MKSKNYFLLALTACLGNLFEHYDTALFSLLAPFLASQFFPQHDPVYALILTYAIIPIGMLARPVGSLFFGYIGDTFGRKIALRGSLIGMAAMTALIGLLPTYKDIGFLAPIFLSLGRILQNFFGAGEIVGGGILLVENATEKQKNLMSGIFGSSTIAGILLASLGVTLFAAYGTIETDWRILYLFGFITACFSFSLRYQNAIPETFFKRNWREFLQEMWNFRSSLFLIAVASGFSYATYSISLVFINAFFPLVTSLTQVEMMKMNTLLLVIDMLTLPLFGILANKYSSQKLMFYASCASFIFAIPLFWIGLQGGILSVLFTRLCIVLIGVWFAAPFYAWSEKIVPQTIRYSLVSFAYAIGSQILGGPASSISLSIYHLTAWPISICFYWASLGLLFAFSTVMLSKTAKNVELA